MTLKRQILALIEALPEDVTLEQIQYRLYLKQRLMDGMAAMKQESDDYDTQARAQMKVLMAAEAKY